MDNPANTPEVAANPKSQAPREIHLDDLQKTPFPQLIELADGLHLKASPDRSRHQIILDLMKFHAQRGDHLLADGILEISADNYGFLRWPNYNFRPCAEDVYVSPALLKKYFLRAGNRVAGTLRIARDKEKFMALDTVISIEGRPAETWTETKHFDNLTPMFPNERIILENIERNSYSARAMDLVTPLGRGQRGLIVAPPRTGKTILLQDIAQAIRANYPEIRLIMLLVDERPEEVTDMKRTVDAEIFSSSFDESPVRHVQVAELVGERARRLLEIGEHVVILLDSITRLSRGYNNMQPGKGRTMSGGVESKALMKPKKFFGAARNVEEGGSLTILATALVETESRMDELIFEEFKGTGNMELHLDRSLVEKRIYPAIQILNSATRREELLYHPDELARIQILRRRLAELPAVEAMEVLLNNLKATRTNAELLMAGLR
ncbi:MAG TPA: transcription termination factor Rho [Chthoniobacteraceae bacterium]|nr:transcription termination factor Rho [Chthoniobacteraceae bacterium]